MGKRVKVGDVIEIPTERGFAYAQYALRKEQWGALLRILPRFFEERPSDLCELVKQKEKFATFFPLQAAVNRKIFEVVTNCPVPDYALDFPLFRDDGHIDRQGKVHNWFLWDGQRSWRVDKLTKEQARLLLGLSGMTRCLFRESNKTGLPKLIVEPLKVSLEVCHRPAFPGIEDE